MKGCDSDAAPGFEDGGGGFCWIGEKWEGLALDARGAIVQVSVAYWRLCK